MPTFAVSFPANHGYRTIKQNFIFNNNVLRRKIFSVNFLSIKISTA